MFKRWWWVFLLAVMIGPVMGLMLAAVVTYVTPKKYESQAVIEVRPKASGLTVPGADAGNMNPRFFATEFEKIKSRESLGKVVKALELENRWAVDKETAARKLKEIVQTENIRETDLISIRVRHTNKVDARDIAMEVANSYKAYRLAIENRDAEQALREMNKVVRDQEVKVEEYGKMIATMERMAKEKGVSPQDMFKRPERTLGSEWDYEDDKKDIDANKALLQAMKLKLSELQIASKIPHDSVVIHQPPVIAGSCVSPDVTKNLIVGTAGGFLVSLLLAAPLVFFLNWMFPASLEPQAHGT